MKIGILCTIKEDYSTDRLKEEAVKRGHEVRILKVDECFVRISSKNPEVHYRGGENIKDLESIIPRIYPEKAFLGLAVLRQFELMGVFPLSNSLAIMRARDKLRSLQILAKYGLPMPATGFVNSTTDADDILTSLGGAPIVIKLVEGMRGEGVVLAETNNAAKSVIEAFANLNANILVQEYIKESQGSDVRCFVVGGEVVASMERRAREGEFRANVSLGAQALPAKITEKERAMAVKAAKSHGLTVAGVDILRTKKGSLVLEVNSSPGLKGIEHASGVNVAEKMILYIEKHAKPYTKKDTA